MKETALFAFAALCSPLATAQDSLAPVAGSAMTAEDAQAAVFPQVIAVLMGSAERFEKALSNLQTNNFFNCESLRELISELNTQNNM